MIKIPPEESYSFDDLLLMPGYSDILPKDVNVGTQLTRRIALSVPIVSAAMDTVTESATAISMAREGGIGFIHRNMSIESQVREIDKVKKSESGMIVDPMTVYPDQLVGEVLDLMKQYRISGLPVVKGQKLMGIVTNRDLRFETDMTKKVSEASSDITISNVRFNYIIIIGLIAAAAISFFNRSMPKKKLANLITNKSIAVLPFEDLSSGGD